MKKSAIAAPTMNRQDLVEVDTVSGPIKGMVLHTNDKDCLIWWLALKGPENGRSITSVDHKLCRTVNLEALTQEHQAMVNEARFELGDMVAVPGRHGCEQWGRAQRVDELGVHILGPNGVQVWPHIIQCRTVQGNEMCLEHDRPTSLSQWDARQEGEDHNTMTMMLNGERIMDISPTDDPDGHKGVTVHATINGQHPFIALAKSWGEVLESLGVSVDQATSITPWQVAIYLSSIRGHYTLEQYVSELLCPTGLLSNTLHVSFGRLTNDYEIIDEWKRRVNSFTQAKQLWVEFAISQETNRYTIGGELFVNGESVGKFSNNGVLSPSSLNGNEYYVALPRFEYDVTDIQRYLAWCNNEKEPLMKTLWAMTDHERSAIGVVERSS
ncbi:hypothetical protein AB6D11_00905 [Vibrio splendidus]